MHTIKNIERFNINQMKLGITDEGSWHKDYDSAYIFVGGLNYKMNQGDIAIVFSEHGEIVDINLARDKITGKSKGFAFIAYQDQRSTVLAVDNFNGIQLCGKTIKVDHVRKYKPPKEYMEMGLEQKQYRPSGPDGRGWGKFRNFTQQQKRILRHDESIDVKRKILIAESIGLT